MFETVLKYIGEKNSTIIVLSLVAGMGNYFYKNLKGDKWNVQIFIMNTGLSLFVGYTVSLMLPEDIGNIDKVIIMITAFTARDVLGIIEIYVPKLVQKRMEIISNNIKK